MNTKNWDFDRKNPFLDKLKGKESAIGATMQTDERSKEMRDLLFSLPPSPEVRDNMKDAMRDCIVFGTGVTDSDPVSIAPPPDWLTVVVRRSELKRCLCCGGMVNHDE